MSPQTFQADKLALVRCGFTPNPLEHMFVCSTTEQYRCDIIQGHSHSKARFRTHKKHIKTSPSSGNTPTPTKRSPPKVILSVCQGLSVAPFRPRMAPPCSHRSRVALCVCLARQPHNSKSRHVGIYQPRQLRHKRSHHTGAPYLHSAEDL